jgi:hypothetical protein
MNAIVVGCYGLGAISVLADCLSRYGYRHITALVNDLGAYNRASHPNVEFFEVPSIFDPSCLFEVLIKKADEGTPILCCQDRLMFSYASAIESFCQTVKWRFHLPADGILRARMKPLARYYWSRISEGSVVDPTSWVVLPFDGNKARLGKAVGCLKVEPEAHYFLKPVCGMGSEMVKMVTGDQIEKVAAEVGEYFRGQIGEEVDRQVTLDDCNFALYKDVLIEEVIAGEEYTIDGHLSKNDVSCVVQHKETQFTSPFVGDGLIVSPPDVSERSLSTLRRKMGDFVRRGAQALGLENWVFHTEIRASPRGPRFVEFNPRPAGGLLSYTAGAHLGTDLFDLCVKYHLQLPSSHVKPGWITGHFPIYAFRTGIFDGFEPIGYQEAARLPGVHVSETAAAGDLIDDIRQENYLAHVWIHAEGHEEIRHLEQQVRGLLKPQWRMMATSS